MPKPNVEISYISSYGEGSALVNSETTLLYCQYLPIPNSVIPPDEYPWKIRKLHDIDEPIQLGTATTRAEAIAQALVIIITLETQS